MAEGPSAALGTVAQRGMMKEQQAWQERVLKNQKQWLYDDLRAAGINPILAAGVGSVSPGTVAPGVSAGGTSIGDEIRKAGVFKAQKEKALADAGAAKNAERISEVQRKIEDMRDEYLSSPEGQREMELRFQNESLYGPLQGVGSAGVIAGAAGGTAKNVKEPIKDAVKHLKLEVEDWFKTKWTGAQDKFQEWVDNYNKEASQR